MSGIFDQIINYSPPLIVSGTVNYKGTWDASANNPTLNSSPAASTKGDYYVVSTAGTQFGITFAIGDWIISNGTAWEKVDLTDAVSSVFGRTGAVVGVSTDYSAVGLTNTAIGASNPSTGAFTTITASSTIAATGAVTGSNLSGTNTGDQTTITGNAGTATALQTARTIGGSSFDGTANVTSFPVPGAIGVTTPAAANFTSIGVTTQGTGAFTTLSATTSALVNRSGVAAPTPVVTNALQLVGNTSESTNLEIDTFAATPFIYGVRAQGTAASPAATASGNNLLAIEGKGYQTVNLSNVSGARILFQATENYTNIASGGKLLLQVVANGTTSLTTVADISSTGLAVTGSLTTSSTTLHTSSVSLTNGAAAALGTLTNAPTAGNPTKWIPIVDNGTTRYIPCW